MANLRITPAWHKPGYHLHTFIKDDVWNSAQFYPTKEQAEQALGEKFKGPWMNHILKFLSFLRISGYTDETVFKVQDILIYDKRKISFKRAETEIGAYILEHGIVDYGRLIEDLNLPTKQITDVCEKLEKDCWITPDN